METFRRFGEGVEGKEVVVINQRKPTADGGGDYYICQKAVSEGRGAFVFLGLLFHFGFFGLLFFSLPPIT